MNEEFTLKNQDVVFAIEVLEQEICSRIQHGDGEIEQLERVLEALNHADRIVIE